MKKAEISREWLQLSTSSQFDRGFETTESLRGDKTVSRKNTLLTSSNSLFIESLIDQLCRLLERDPKERLKVYNAICSKLCDLRLIDDTYRCEELSSLRGHYHKALSSFLWTPDTQAPLLETSRYALEFEELGWIASGGFGQVFRARHRLDQVEYAVKKIKVRYKDAAMFLRTLAEVKTLARLNHVNIVHYKAAWLEASPVPAEPVIVDADSGDASDGVVFQHSREEESESSSGEDNQLALCRLQPPPGSAAQMAIDGRHFRDGLQDILQYIFDAILRKYADKSLSAVTPSSPNDDAPYALVSLPSSPAPSPPDADLPAPSPDADAPYTPVSRPSSPAPPPPDADHPAPSPDADAPCAPVSRPSSPTPPPPDADAPYAPVSRPSSPAPRTPPPLPQPPTPSPPLLQPPVRLKTGAILYVSMQLCDETLRQWLDRRNTANAQLDLKLALHIVRQAAAGIAYIHSCNVVHHDIKPSNIFITGDMHVQVGDFGLACTLHGGACPVGAGQRGTSLYAAPEQQRGQCHQRSDLFSLGLVLLELVSPFSTAMERVAVLNKVRGRQLPPDLPAPLEELLRSLTAPRPDWRPTAGALMEQLDQLREDAVKSATEADKDSTINELRRLLAERDSEIRELRKSLSQSSDESRKS